MSKFPLYEELEKLGVSNSVRITELSAKLRSLQEDPSKREEAKEIYTHIILLYYHHYTKVTGSEPNSPSDVPYLGKICSGGHGVISNITQHFPFALVSYIDEYTNRNTIS